MERRWPLLAAVDPGAPHPDRRLLRRVAAGGSYSGAAGGAWTVAGGLLLLASAGVLIAGLIGWGAFPTWVVVAVVASAGLACLVESRRQLRHARQVLANHLISGDTQARATRGHPSLRTRLDRATELTHRLHLHRHEPALSGVLAIDRDLLDRLHYQLVKELIEVAPLAAAVADAAEVPELADRVQARQQELAAVEAALDTQMDQMAALVTAVDAVLDALQRADHVDALAQRLDTAPTPAAAVAVGPVADDDLPARITTAQAALELLTDTAPPRT